MGHQIKFYNNLMKLEIGSCTTKDLNHKTVMLWKTRIMQIFMFLCEYTSLRAGRTDKLHERH